MERVLKWSLPLLIALEVVLVWSGLIDLGTAVGMVIVIEALLFLVAGRQIFVAVRRYRQDRAAGLDVWAALEEGLAVLMPRQLARFVVLEPRLWHSLAIWLSRRGPSDASSFSYRKRSILGAFVVVLLLTAPVEILLFELLIPWSWLRWLLLVVSIYAVIWVIGLYASIVVRPHRLMMSELLVRYGALAEARVPYDAIQSVDVEKRKAPSLGDGLQVGADDDMAYFAIGGRTDVTLHLRTPISISAMFGAPEPVETIHLVADEPELLAHELRQRVPTAEQHPETTEQPPAPRRPAVPSGLGT